MKKVKKEIIRFWHQYYLLLSFLIFFLLRLPSVFEPFTYGDEGIYLTLGQAFRKGLVFYRDIHDNKPPLLYLMAALGGNFQNYRLLCLLWSEFGFFLFYLLAKNLFEKSRRALELVVISFAILSPLPLFEGTIANAENFLIYTSTAGFLLLISKKQKKSAFFLAGFLFSLSTLFKVPAALDFGAALVVFFLLSKKKIRQILISLLKPRFWLLIIGFLIPISLSFLYYFSKGAGLDYFKAAFAQNLPYLSSWVKDSPQVFSFPLGLVLRGVGLVLLLGGLFFLRKKRFPAPALNLILVWFAFSVFGALLSSRPYPHYLYQALPALCLSLGLLFSSPKAIRFTPLIFTLLLFYIFVHFNYYHYQTWSYYQNFYHWVSGQKSKSEYLKFWGSHVDSLYQTAAYLKTHTKEGEKIFIWGDQPSLYSLAERLPAGRYAAAYHIKDFDKGYQETSTTLSQNPPRFFVVFKNEEGSLGPLLPFLKTNYSHLKTVGEIMLYYRLPSLDGKITS